MNTLVEELVQERIRPETDHRILICGGIPCSSLGCRRVKEALDEELQKEGLTDEVPVEVIGCIGDCSLGPSLIVYPEGIVYQKLVPEDARTIVRDHLIAGRIVEELLHRDPRSDEIIRRREEMPFYREQTRLVLRNCGVISAHIDDYLKYRGYAALARALAEIETGPDLVEMCIRDRGGAYLENNVTNRCSFNALFLS